MAFHLESGDDYGSSLSDINVTPLVDVMLVLLIIFMVTAPMLTQGLAVELPQAEGANFETQQTDPITISVTRSGAVYVDDTPVGSTNLEITLGTLLRSQRVKRALIKADRNVPYGQVVQVIDIMNRAGVEEVGMITRAVEVED